MKKNLLLIGLLLMGMNVFVSCDNDDVDSPAKKEISDNDAVNCLTEYRGVGKKQLSAKHQTYVNKGNGFAFNLFRKAFAESGMGAVISPFSTEMSLGMLNAGASDAASEEIIAALGFDDATVSDVNEYFLKMQEGTARLNEHGSCTLSNGFFVNSHYGFTIPEDYGQVLETYYEGVGQELDFTAADAQVTINQWCSERTNGKVADALSKIDPQAAAYLVNAIYLNQPWAAQFKTNYTQEASFYGEETSSVDMMHQKAYVKYAENDLCAALALPYADAGFHMMVLLPNEDVSVNRLVNSLSATTWSELIEGEEDVLADIRLPKFTVGSKNDLSSNLQALGIKGVFKYGGLANVNGASGLMLSRMLQSVSMEVTEDGTEAEATTVSEETWYTSNHGSTNDDSGTEYRKVDFTANRPFVFVIADMYTDAVYFIGTYMSK